MGLRQGLRYRGGAGMWAWVLHRITGLGVLLFLAVHIVETFLLAFGPEVYDSAVENYATPFFRVLEVGLVFAVLYHAVNGIRITIQDLWPSLWRHERVFVYATYVIVIVAFVPLAVLLLLPILRGEL